MKRGGPDGAKILPATTPVVAGFSFGRLLYRMILD